MSYLWLQQFLFQACSSNLSFSNWKHWRGCRLKYNTFRYHDWCKVHRDGLCRTDFRAPHKIFAPGHCENDLVWVQLDLQDRFDPYLIIFSFLSYVPSFSFSTWWVSGIVFIVNDRWFFGTWLPMMPHRCSLHLLLRYLTFWRRYKSVWANTLRFLPQTTHGTCDTCLDCKERFKTCQDTWSNFKAAIKDSNFSSSLVYRGCGDQCLVAQNHVFPPNLLT